MKAAKNEYPLPTGKQVVIIGAGNVGCDVAAECYRLGTDSVTLLVPAIRGIDSWKSPLLEL